MPLITISISEGFSLADKRTVADCVHDAMVGVGFPETDRFQKIFRLTRDQFIYDRCHPDLEEPRSARFVLIEIVMPEGRSRDLKKDLLMIIIENLRERLDVRADDVMVLFTETDRENWSYYRGVQYYSERADRALRGTCRRGDGGEVSIADFPD